MVRYVEIVSYYFCTMEVLAAMSKWNSHSMLLKQSFFTHPLYVQWTYNC